MPFSSDARGRARAMMTALAFVAMSWPDFALAKDCAGLDTQAALNMCEGGNFKEADTALNAAFSKLIAKVSANGQAKLREAQKSWIKYRDQQCAFETLGTIGGTIHGMVVAQCLTELTTQQTKRLLHQLNCEEGDVSCGGQ
jgi:uncharacterized protein YecT (DUF1311 family)